MQKAAFQLEFAMWSTFLGLWLQSAMEHRVGVAETNRALLYFEIVSSTHFFPHEELLLNIPGGLSGEMASSSSDHLCF